MSYLVFPTKDLAFAAEAQISAAFGMPYTLDNGYTAARWAVPVELADGRWAFHKPDEAAMAGLTGFEEVAQPAFKEVE
ncbi:MAG: hypothetical protein R3D70_05800 [Rhizobiaceae bacterium]